jgi:predicted RNase H-like HicB family nuclease
MKQVKIVIEKHSDGYVAYPIGLTGAIVGQGDSYDEALADVKSAIACYVEVFEKDMLDNTNWHLGEVQRRVASQDDLPKNSWDDVKQRLMGKYG